MHALRLSIRMTALAVAALAAGCTFPTTYAYTELNNAPSARPSRDAAAVEVYASAPPTRPHVDVRTIMAFKGNDTDTNVVQDLRAEAGRLGCDAIFVHPVARLPEVPASRATATCIDYTDR